jgi:hypothetical protein
VVCYDDAKDLPSSGPAKIGREPQGSQSPRPDEATTVIARCRREIVHMNFFEPFDHSDGVRVHDLWRTPLVTTNGCQNDIRDGQLAGEGGTKPASLIA